MTALDAGGHLGDSEHSTTGRLSEKRKASLMKERRKSLQQALENASRLYNEKMRKQAVAKRQAQTYRRNDRRPSLMATTPLSSHGVGKVVYKVRINGQGIIKDG
jgi:hypothetical protein